MTNNFPDTLLDLFLMPPTEALNRELSFDKTWEHGGPWKSNPNEQ